MCRFDFGYSGTKKFTEFHIDIDRLKITVQRGKCKAQKGP